MASEKYLKHLTIIMYININELLDSMADNANPTLSMPREIWKKLCDFCKDPSCGCQIVQFIFNTEYSRMQLNSSTKVLGDSKI